VAATLAGYAHRVGQSREGEALQSFTAIGVVTSGEIYQVEMSPDFRPYRVDVSYLDCREAPIKPLIERLSFMRSKTHWGAAFRFGRPKIPADDFALIAQAMGRAAFERDADKVAAERVRSDLDAAERGAA
jgi:hypothetical protein